MKKSITILSFLLIPALAQAASSAEQRKKLLDRIEAGCSKTLAKKIKPAEALKVCSCVAKNFGLRPSNSELALMADFYEDKKEALKKLKEEKYEALSYFDDEVAEGCIEDHNFKVETGEDESDE